MRYDAGIIQDWQLDLWAEGTVETIFPAYKSLSQLTDAEWTSMAYRSMNTYGFVGYQFGEALLIDLGYYDDDFYYGNGAATNTWDGAWTGKNGVDSLDEFMTAEAQDVAIREAFGHNLGIIETGLAAAGKSLDEFLGATLTHNRNGEEVAVTLTLTGILSGAHLRGAPAVVELLPNNTVSADEYGTSILQYIEQFGGYDAPAIPELVAYFEDRLTGDEGLGTPGETDVASGNGTAGVTADSADVVITWTWGQDAVVTGFDPAADTIYVDWFSADDVRLVEVGGSTVFLIAGNNQSTTIEGVSLAELSAANFTINDAGLAGEILGAIGTEGSSGQGSGDTATGDGGDGTSTSGDAGSESASDSTNANGAADVTAADATVVITWTWGQDPLIDGFDPAHDTIFIDWFHAGEVEIFEAGGNVVFAVPGNNQSTTLADLSLADLSAANFTIKDAQLGAEILSAIGSGNAAGSDDGGGSGDTGGSGSDDVAGDPDSGSGGAQPNGEVDVFRITWDWGVTETVSDFVASEDVLDFGSLPANLVSISEIDGNLTIEVLNNGGHMYVLEGVQAEDLAATNLSAPAWNGVLVAANGVLDQLAALGNQDIALV